jgi:hypothetical protein
MVVSIAVRLRHSNTLKEDLLFKLQPLLGNKLHGIEWLAPSAVYIRETVIRMTAKVVQPTDIASPFMALSIRFQDNHIYSAIISPLCFPFQL